MRRNIALCSTILLLYSLTASAAVKPQYGGNLKVADELLSWLPAQKLFADTDGTLLPLFPFPYTTDGSDLTIDLTSFNPDLFTEMEKGLLALQKPENACHWILDYPYLSHHHATVIEARDGKIHIHAESPEVLLAIAESPCLMPEPISALQPFIKTQFGYEANPNCSAGRPFLDSITPAPVDPINPYLSFKLNDADVIPIPEDRYQQVSQDPDLQVASGPRYLVFLQTQKLTQATAAAIASSIRVSDLARAVLNGHAEPLLNSAPAMTPKPGTRFRLVYPQDAPYRLIGERMELELKEAGFEINPTADSAALPVLKMEVFQLPAGNDELARYRLLRNYFPDGAASDAPWFDTWDEYEASGKILPLFIHATTVAVRKGVQNLRFDSEGIPDFSSAWLEPHP